MIVFGGFHQQVGQEQKGQRLGTVHQSVLQNMQDCVQIHKNTSRKYHNKLLYYKQMQICKNSLQISVFLRIVIIH